MRLSERIAAILAIDPSSPAIEFEGEWTTWGALAEIATAVRDLTTDLGGPSPVAVGVVLANRPEIAAATLGVLLAEGCVVTLNPHQGDRGLAGDLRELRPPVVVATESDWARSGLRDVAAEIGLVGIAIGATPDGSAHPVDGLGELRADPYREAQEGVAVEMLTSGTTGPPKRLPLRAAAFESTITAAGAHYRTGGGSEDDAPRLRRGVALVTSPFVHMSGIFRMLLNVCEGRRIALMERFRVTEWAELVRRHRPRAVSLVPAAVRMVYDAGVDPEVFESVEVVTSGSAALDPDLQQRFEERYGVAVLPSYGATEFAGGVAGWTLSLHREWIDLKRGSVGRPQPRRLVRVVDPETGDARPPSTSGVLEVATVGEEAWVRTTDVARIDEDGFVWIEGRMDDAILRGGFKVFPTAVADALRTHPSVLDAGVVGVADDRLGNVPVAAVELRAGAEVTAEDLLAHAAEHLPAYQLPSEIRIVRELPRTPSLKVSGPGVRALFEEAG